MKESKFEDGSWFLIVILVLILLVYVLSLGNINYIDAYKNDRNKWIEHRIKKLEKLISSKKKLKEKLDQCVRKSFFITRIIISVLYLILNIIIFFLVKPQNFNDKLSLLLNYNQIFLIALLIICFIKFEKPSNLDTLIYIIHLKIKKIVYGKFTGLETDVLILETELGNLNEEKETLNISFFNRNANDAFEEDFKNDVMKERQKDNENNKLIFAIWGTSGVGKTTAIKAIAVEIKTKFPTAIFSESIENLKWKDFEVVITIDNVKVGITSKGDPGTDLYSRLKSLEKDNCAVIICATRTRGETEQAVRSMDGYKCVWLTNYYTYDVAERDNLNSMFAQDVVNLMKRKLRI